MARDKLQLGPEHFYAHLFQSGGLVSILICIVCLIIVFAIVFFFATKTYMASRRQAAAGGPQVEELRRRQYQEVLGHMRALESLRLERELLVKRTLRVVQSWQHMLPIFSDPVQQQQQQKNESDKDTEKRLANKKAVTLVEDLAEEVRQLGREHQMLLRNCIATLGEHDTAGVLKPDEGSAVWQKALEHAQRDAEKRIREMQQKAAAGKGAVGSNQRVELLPSSGDDESEEEFALPPAPAANAEENKKK